VSCSDIRGAVQGGDFSEKPAVIYESVDRRHDRSGQGVARGDDCETYAKVVAAFLLGELDAIIIGRHVAMVVVRRHFGAMVPLRHRGGLLRLDKARAVHGGRSIG
jgi:hypothetical protein